jgi:pyruvate carboxylase
LNGQPREVVVRDRRLNATTTTRIKVDPQVPGQVGAPIPGMVTSVTVQTGAAVSVGDTLMTMEAMKMQATVTAPQAGKVTQILVVAGQQVEAKDLLIVIE